MSDDIAIKVENVSKTFKLPHSKSDSIKSKLISLKDRKRGFEIQQALKDISFEVKKGEFFGIVGRNGSGKSTLLKLISGIYTPTSGNIQVNGKLTPFIELGVGFNPELSGRDNVFLNGALLGFNRQEMEEMYDEIVEFAELERFMDQKLKNYSSGMQVRLAFSIAIRANTDILVLDEVLAVGDEAFQRKCSEYFDNVRGAGKTVILVTHSMDSVRKFCTRAMLLNKGTVKTLGDPDIVSEQYSQQNAPKQVATKYEDKKGGISISYEKLYTVGDDMRAKISWRQSGVSGVGIALYKTSGERIFATNTKDDKFTVKDKSCVYKLKLSVAPDDYFLRVRIYKNGTKTSIGLVEKTPPFTVLPDERAVDGLVLLKHEWSTND